MAPAKLFERNIRPQRAYNEDDLDLEDESPAQQSLEESDDASALQDESVSGQSDVDDDNDDQDDEQDDDLKSDHSANSEDGTQIQNQLSSVSFGALKAANDSISRKRKRGSETMPEQDDKLAALRARLHQIREEKESQGRKAAKRQQPAGPTIRPTAPSNGNDVADNADSDDSSSASDSDSAPSEADNGNPHARSSKHAPMAQTSKRQVTRRRQVVDVAKRRARDPRFDAFPSAPARGGATADDAQTNSNNSDKAYAFIRDYQQSEIRELQTALKRTRGSSEAAVAARDTLRRKLVSLQNTLKTHAARERTREVVRAHRAAEREAVQQGKAPFFLKQAEVRARALAEQFRGLGARERDKLVRKRRLKEGQREKRRMPVMRRRPG